MRVDRLEIEVDDGNRLVWDRSLDHDSPSEYVARVMERRSIKLLDVCCEDEPDRELRWRRSTGGAFPISRSRAHTHRRHGHPLQTVPSAGLIERPQEKNRVDALR